MAELALAGVRRYVSVGANRDPRVELIAANPIETLGDVALKPTISAPDPFKNLRRDTPASSSAVRASFVIDAIRACRASRGFIGLLPARIV
jgi:hypothetical protein